MRGWNGIWGEDGEDDGGMGGCIKGLCVSVVVRILVHIIAFEKDKHLYSQTTDITSFRQYLSYRFLPQARMRVPSSITIQQNNQIYPTLTLPVSSSATIHFTMSPNAKQPKKHSNKSKKYRAMERPDGVIIEYPRYHPSTSPAPQGLQFEKKLFTLPARVSPTPRSKNPATPAPARAVPRDQDFELSAIGAFAAQSGRDGYNDVVLGGRDGYNDVALCGRGGYNSAFDLNAEARSMRDQRDAGRGRSLAPMQRFMDEEGPWGAFELRGR